MAPSLSVDIKRIEAEKAAAIAKVEGMLSQLGL